MPVFRQWTQQFTRIRYEAGQYDQTLTEIEESIQKRQFHIDTGHAFHDERPNG